MRRPLSADPLFFTLLDAEARLLGCSSPAIVRTACLEFIARNHQSRIPGFFKKEREIAIYSDSIKKVYIMYSHDETIQELSKISAENPDALRLAIYDYTVQYLETERAKVFKRTRP